MGWPSWNGRPSVDDKRVQVSEWWLIGPDRGGDWAVTWLKRGGVMFIPEAELRNLRDLLNAAFAPEAQSHSTSTHEAT